MTVTLVACHKDSSAGYTETLSFDNKEEFLEQYKAFESNVPFSRWYIDVASEEDETEELVNEWLDS